MTALGHFVLLRHDGVPEPHYDLMIEEGEALATWSMEAPPGAAGGAPSACRKIKDHRKDYLAYEGPVAGDRGEVRACDRGTARWLSTAEARRVVELRGGAVRGIFVLERAGTSASWEMRREEAVAAPDPEASET